MALSTDKKLLIAVGALAVLGGIFYVQNKKQKEEAKSYTAETRSAELPKLELGDDKLKTIDEITITKAGQDGGATTTVTLKKTGENWQVTAPVTAAANDTNVKSLIDNLKTLEIKESIDPSKDAYAKFGVSDDKALHAVFKKGADVVADLYFGESGTRGQMTRIAGKDGVYSVKGYSSFLYDREVKDWRDRTVFKFDEDKVKAVEITNENGSFLFAKDGDTWTAKHKGPKAPMAKALEKFDDSKVKDAIRAFKGLNADGFGEGKKLSDVNLETPLATITFTLSDDAKRTLSFGATAEGTSRWAKKGDSEEILSLGSWAADWAFAKADKFQKSDDKKDDKGKGEGDEPPALDLSGLGNPHGGH